jgi:hypothetical protein
MPLTLALVFALLRPAWAQDAPTVPDTLDQARAALEAKDWAKARALIDAAEKLAPESPGPVLHSELARIFFYRGVIAWYGGDRDKGALEAWRKARVVSFAYEPDASVLKEEEAQDVFYALGAEVQQQAQVVLNLPEDSGDATIFVSGQRREPQDSVFAGPQFLQVRCEDGVMHGAWVNLREAPADWLAPCKGGTWAVEPKDPKQAAREKKDAEKRAAAEAKARAEAEKRAAAEARAQAAATAEAAAKAEADAKAQASAKAEPKPTAKVEPKPTAKVDDPAPAAAPEASVEQVQTLPPEVLRRRRTAAVGVIATGGAMLAGGAAMNWLVVGPARTEADAANATPGSISREDALDLLARYDNGRFSTIGLLTAGVVTMGTGVAMLPKSTRVVVTPTMLGLSGSW